MKEETKEILKNIYFRLYCDSPMSKKYGIELGENECKILLDYITNLQEELKEYEMIFDTFSKRPYAHRYLEEKKKELGNNKIIGLDSEMIYKDYYNLKKENQKISESYGKSVSKQYLDRIDTLNNRIEELNNDKQELKKERDNIIKEKENITTEMSELKRKYELTNKNWNNQNQVMENMQTQINVSHKVNEELREKIEQLQKEIKEKDIEIEAYKNAIQNISFNFNGTIKSTSKKVSKSKGE